MNNAKTKFFGANLTYFLIIIFFVLIRLLSSINAFSFLGEGASYVLSFILQVGLMLVLPIWLYSFLIKQKPKQTLKTYGVKKISFTAIGISFLIGILVFFLNIGISSFFQFLISILGFEKLPQASTSSYPTYLLFVNLIFTAVLPAICEEITHRGMLISSYHSLGYKKAIIYSSLLFGLTHLNIEQFFYATIVGLFLGFLTVITGNIIPAMIVHFVNNAINVFLSYALARSVKLTAIYNQFFQSLQSENFVFAVAVIFMVLSFMLFAIGLLMIKLFKETAVNELNQIAIEETKKQLRADLLDEPLPIQHLQNKIPVQVGFGKTNKFFNIYVPAESIGVPIRQIYFPDLKSNIFLIASIFLTTLITIFTFIWGVL